MKRIYTFLTVSLLIIALTLSPISALAASPLVGEWYCNDGDSHLVHTLIFNADGTGSSISPSSTIDIVDWKLLGNDVQFSYYWGGSLSTASGLYTYTNTVNGPAIVFDNGSRHRVFLPATEDDETAAGLWLCVLSDNTVVTLELKPDSTASLKVGSLTYNAAWSVSGSTLTLMQNGNPLQGTLNGSKLVLSFAGVTLDMRRMDVDPNAAAREDLIGEWYCDDFDPYLVHTLIFQANGKGVSINPASSIDIVDWKLVGNDVQFSYYRDGELTTASGLYTYTTTGDDPVIVYDNGFRQRTFKLMTEMDEDDYYGL